MISGSRSSKIFLALACVLFGAAFRASVLGGQQEQAPPPKIIRKAGGVLTGAAIRRVEPTYPPLAKAAHVMGAVVVEITIDEEGSVISANAISGHQLLKGAAVEAAQQWKFKPTLLQGTPVKVVGTITFKFEMGDESSGVERIHKALEAVSASPSSPEARLELGRAYIDNNQYAQAVDPLKDAIRMNAKGVSAYILLGSALDHQSQFDEEIKLYREALVMFPDSSEVLQPLARALAYSQRWDEALEIQKRIVASGAKQGPEYLELSFYLFKTGDYGQAVAAARTTVESGPRYCLPIAYNILGASYEQLGQYADAIDSYQHLLEGEPDNPFTLDHIGWAYHQMGQSDEAERNLARAAQIIIDSEQVQIPRSVPGGVPDGTPQLLPGRPRITPGSALAGPPSKASLIFEHLGDVYAQGGKKDLAVDAWHKALNVAQDPADVSRIKGKLESWTR